MLIGDRFSAVQEKIEHDLLFWQTMKGEAEPDRVTLATWQVIWTSNSHRHCAYGETSDMTSSLIGIPIKKTISSYQKEK